MSLFECQECHVVENTACCHYHWRKHRGEALLCSQCDPEIGEWHGAFERVLVKDTNYETVTEGNFKGTLQPPGGWDAPDLQQRDEAPVTGPRRRAE